MNRNAAARKKKHRSRQPDPKPPVSQMETRDPGEVKRVKAVVFGIERAIKKQMGEE